MILRNTPNRVESLIGKGMAVKGALHSAATIRVEGAIEGDISCDEDVIIGETARVCGNISGKNVSISGEVEGNITSKEKVEIGATATVRGDIMAVGLVVQSGALFIGTSNMCRDRSMTRERAVDEILQNTSNTEPTGR